MKILVTGGAGYIGSVTVKRLQEKGFEVVVFDNLEYGHKDAVNAPLIVGDLTDKEFLTTSLKDQHFDGVIHFAAYALAGESMKDPNKYFYSNLAGGLNLLEVMREKSVNKIVFSSTCAIYGFPDKLPVKEDESKKPVSVYGESKLMFESILKWYDQIYGIKNVCLRYFNAAGAALDATLGERHNPETHIIPIAIEAALGKRDKFVLNGNDYKTPDGTCIRDYIHVEDLAQAHISALDLLEKTNKSDFFNLGTGQGYSNMEVLNMVKKVSGKDFAIEVSERRVGDPDAIYADNSKAREILKFNPVNSDLKTIVETAWKWHSRDSGK